MPLGYHFVSPDLWGAPAPSRERIPAQREMHRLVSPLSCDTISVASDNRLVTQAIRMFVAETDVKKLRYSFGGRGNNGTTGGQGSGMPPASAARRAGDKSRRLRLARSYITRQSAQAFAGSQFPAALSLTYGER